MHKIGELDIAGIDYRVFIATSDEAPGLADSYGYTSTQTQRIYLKEGISFSQMRDTLFHEIVHAFLECSGIGAYLASQVKGEWDDVEETLIRLLVPAGLRMLDDNNGELAKLLCCQPKASSGARLRKVNAK